MKSAECYQKWDELILITLTNLDQMTTSLHNLDVICVNPLRQKWKNGICFKILLYCA